MIEDAMFNRLPSALQREFLFARMEAARERAAEIRPGHVLLGLITSRHTLVGRMLQGVRIQEARAALSNVPPDAGAGGRQDIVESAATQQVLRQAAEEAAALFKSLGPGDRVLLTVRGVTPPFRAGDAWCWVGPIHADDSTVVAVSLALDSVVFEDGRIAGADTYDIGSYLHGRHEAALTLSRQVLEAEQAGGTAEAVIARVARERDAAQDSRQWPRRLAMSARHAQEWLRRMPDLPAPPQFWRKQG